jgi:DNA-binding IclR family transcriptional regulator
LNQSVGLSIWREHGAFFVQYEKSQKLINLSFDIGQYVPLYTATGKIFRAYLPEYDTNEIYRKEIVGGRIDPSHYDFEIEQIKKNGYSIYNDDGTTAISAPVFYQSEELAGAVTVAEIQGVLDQSAQALTAKELKQTAYEISREMGFTGDF